MKQETVIIRRKKRKHHGHHHGGAWKVAYADFVTAMMAFFLVMWITAQSPQSRAAVAAYFRDPGVFDNGRHTSAIEGGPLLAADQPAPPEPDTTALAQAAEELRKAIAGLPELESLRDRIEITLTPEGLLIELLEADDDGFFQVGSAVVTPAATKLLHLIAERLARLPNKVAIEGHTDGRPFQAEGLYTNWELSSDRANAARRAMHAAGLQPTQIAAVHGFADTKPRFGNAPLDARNRRISILVKNGNRAR
jgi:chemotaxis protein MotB